MCLSGVVECAQMPAAVHRARSLLIRIEGRRHGFSDQQRALASRGRTTRRRADSAPASAASDCSSFSNSSVGSRGSNGSSIVPAGEARSRARAISCCVQVFASRRCESSVGDSRISIGEQFVGHCIERDTSPLMTRRKCGLALERRDQLAREMSARARVTRPPMRDRPAHAMRDLRRSHSAAGVVPGVVGLGRNRRRSVPTTSSRCTNQPRTTSATSPGSEVNGNAARSA